jgi:Predicted transmembrane sensor domain
MFRKLIFPHSLIVTLMMFLLIWLINSIRINLHFLNPFNETIRDYEITDIVYSRLRDPKIELDKRIVLINSGMPNRDTLRMVIDRAIEAGAKVIAVDLLLADRKEPKADSMLRASVQRFENIVLGVKLDGYNEKTDMFEFQRDCDSFFCDYAYTGFTNFPSNDTRTIRYFSPREMTPSGECLSFAYQAAKRYDPESTERALRRVKNVEEIFFTGNSDDYVQFEAGDVLDPTVDLRSRLKDKIVLIGFLGTYAWDDPLLDRYYTPLNERYTSRNTPDMYGVVIHANIIRMVLDHKFVNETPWWINLLLTTLFCYFNIHLYYKIFRKVSVSYHFITRFIQLGEIIILFFLVALLFHLYRVKMDVGYWITVLVLAFDGVRFYDTFLRRRIALLSKLPDVLPPARKPEPPKPPGEPDESTASEGNTRPQANQIV